ncbi:hypothetical protein CKALI_12205 [Corynebacterium kalinowskii]|uniref:Uncharacterized protein n=1 Tax=Corynebacterium kalinowskii TaxID=2675216 RepID=A0A6B8VJP3_9CORY|nr:hypothetical protein [Corynebacterium kalinowskii]QGU03279.1 hypothetical protein CKALI_12205 [Corynebacterium kalinowskii]
MKLLYVKTTLRVPGIAPVVHLAELEHAEGSPLCKPARMLEATEDGLITGAFRRQPPLNHGMSHPPQQLIPHPDSWGDLPDITSDRMTAEEFEGLWQEAMQKF